MIYDKYHYRISEGKCVRLIVNSDAKNEADDQFAIVQAPLITDNMTYAVNRHNRPIRVYREVDGRFILEDFFAKLALFVKRKEQRG